MIIIEQKFFNIRGLASIVPSMFLKNLRNLELDATRGIYVIPRVNLLTRFTRWMLESKSRKYI